MPGDPGINQGRSTFEPDFMDLLQSNTEVGIVSSLGPVLDAREKQCWQFDLDYSCSKCDEPITGRECPLYDPNRKATCPRWAKK